jgi:hypothetical protein
MHNRCYNPSNKSYKDYGGRGIFVRPEWHGKEGFDRFLSDMGFPPAGCSLDRKNNDGPYGAENCFWATKVQQASNKRNSRHITANGKTQTMAAWARELGCSPATILLRIQKGMTPEASVTAPVQNRPNSKLDAEQVLSIVQSYPSKTFAALACEYGVSKKTVMNIVHGRIYKDVLQKAEV